MVTLVNISGGNLHLESLGIHLDPGGRLPFDLERDVVLIKAPEIALYVQRGRAVLLEQTEDNSAKES